MKSKLLISSIIFVLMSCNKNQQTVPGTPSSYHIAFEFDGDQKTLEAGGSYGDFIWTNGYPDEFQDPANDTDGEYAGGFENANGSKYATVDIQVTYNNGTFEADRQGTMDSWFSPGSHSYAANQNNSAGFGFTYGQGGAHYNTYDGSQSGSVFTITELLPVDFDVYPELAIKGTFNCTLYDSSSGSSHAATNGTFHVRFSLG